MFGRVKKGLSSLLAIVLVLGAVLISVPPSVYGEPLPPSPLNQPVETVYTGTEVTFDDIDDGVSGPLDIGFDFNFYGSVTNSVYASTNGLLMFENPSSNCCDSGETLPLSDLDHYITPFYHDLYVGSNSKVMYTTMGSAPNRKFVIQFTNMLTYDNSNYPNDPFGTFQAILYESTNDIQFQYPNLVGIRENDAAFGSDALIGLQSLTGNLATYSQKTKSLSEKQAIRLSPNDDLSSYTISSQAAYEPILLTNNLFPDPPILASPADGAFSSLNPTFQWNNSGGASSYRLLVATDPEFLTISIVVDQSGITGNSFDVNGLLDGTAYYWKVVEINNDEFSLSNTFSFKASSILPATVDTDANVSNITSTTATAGGNITSDGGDPVTERGVVYSMNANPTISDGKVTADSDGIGIFSVNLTGLQSESTYHIRAYATNGVGTSYGPDVTFTTLSSNANLNTLSLSGIVLDQTVTGSVYTYTASVPHNVTVTSVTYTPASNYASVDLQLNGNPISNPINLNVGTNVITILVTAQDNSQIAYTVNVTRAAAPPSGGGGGSTPPPTTPTDTKVTSTDGNLTLSAGQTGEVSLEDEVVVSIPEGAIDEELELTIEKVQDTQHLLTDKDVLVSPVFEILKNFSENFNKPVTLTFVFDPTSLKSNQRPSVFYYDEVDKVWVEVAGGKVNGNRITAEVDHFTKFAVLAVGTELPTPDTTAEVDFSDISGHWAETRIKQALAGGIVSGYSDGTFKPGKLVTRAEFAVMLMNTLELQEEGAELTFTDTAKIRDWAKKAVAQAVQAGIIKGYDDGSFRPDAEITRAEMAVMIANALNLSLDENTSTSFADDKDIPEWAKGAAAALQNLGIIKGKDANAFDPAGHTTRAEAVTVILRMLELKSK